MIVSGGQAREQDRVFGQKNLYIDGGQASESDRVVTGRTRRFGGGALRWTFTDPTVPETWSHPINPDNMTSPLVGRNVTSTRGGVRDPLWTRPRLFENKPAVKEWTFGGVIRSKAQYDELLRWSRKSTPIRVSDHLGRTFEVIFTAFTPTDRRLTPNVPWRARYEMTCILLRRV